MPRPRELRVPHFQMETWDWCGPATLKMFLRCYGIQVSQTQLARISKTTKANGTPAKGMKRAMRHFGIKYRTKVGATFSDIEKALIARKPTIIVYREPTDEEPHYAIPVVLGKTYVGFRDSWNSQKRKDKKTFSLSRDDFYERWTDQQRWILIPLHAPPGWRRRRTRR